MRACERVVMDFAFAFARAMERVTRRAAVAVAMLLVTHWAFAEDIVLGQTSTASNPLVSAMASEYTAGIQLALHRTNAAGGIRGHKIRLASRDDNFDPAKTVKLIEELVEQEQALALVGVLGTQPVLRVAQEQVLQKYTMASFGPITGLQAALSTPNVFPVRASYEDEVRAMLVHSASLGRRKVLYLYVEAGVGVSLAKQVPAMAQAANVALTGVVGFPLTSDRSQQAAAMLKVLDPLKDKPEAIVLLAIGSVHSEAVKGLRSRFGLGIPIYSLGQVNPRNL